MVQIFFFWVRIIPALCLLIKSHIFLLCVFCKFYIRRLWSIFRKFWLCPQVKIEFCLILFFCTWISVFSAPFIEILYLLKKPFIKSIVYWKYSLWQFVHYLYYEHNNTKLLFGIKQSNDYKNALMKENIYTQEHIYGYMYMCVYIYMHGDL